MHKPSPCNGITHLHLLIQMDTTILYSQLFNHFHKFYHFKEKKKNSPWPNNISRVRAISRIRRKAAKWPKIDVLLDRGRSVKVTQGKVR